MDDDLDDLFGEASQLELPIRLVKGLLQRVDEKCSGGCRQKLSWSKIGCISYISSDARKVILQHLLCDPSDGRWKLSKDYLMDENLRYHGNIDLVHLSWSHTGNELAIVDRLGRISIYTLSVAINRFNISRRCNVDSEDDLGAVVGMTWLYADKPTYLSDSMIKSNGLWKFSCSQQRPTGPRNPSLKPTLVVVHCTGIVKALIQDKLGHWQVIKDDSQEIASTSRLLTHAAMCADKGDNKDDILLATYNIIQELHVYRVRINIDQASLKLFHLKIVPDCAPFDGVIGSSLIPEVAFLSSAQLSCLEFVPAGPESKIRASTQPFVLAVFSCVSDGFANGGDRSSVVCRWEMQVSKPKMHSGFDLLSSKKQNASSTADLPVESVLKRLPDISMPRILLSVQQINLSIVLALIFDDGMVEFRDRTRLDLLLPDSDDQISSLNQIGFALPQIGPCLHAIVSPNACALFSLDEEYTANMNMMQFVNQKSNLSGEGYVELVNQAFVAQCYIETLTQTTFFIDDLLATMQLFATQFLETQTEWDVVPTLSGKSSFDERFMNEIYRILDVKTDHSMETNPDPLFKTPLVQRVLSIHATLGFSGVRMYRSVASNLAWATLNIRYLSVAFVFACQKKSAPDSELRNPDTVSYLLHLFSWSMALNNFLMDELFVLGDQLEDEGLMNNGLNCNVLNQKIRKMNSPAILLLFASSSRAILRYNVRYLTTIGLESSTIQKSDHNSPERLKRLYQEIGMIMKGSHVKLDQMNKLISHIDDSIKSAYQASAISDADRRAAETNMLIKAELPQVLMEPLEQLLTTTVPKLKEEINVAELYLTDHSWIGVTGNNNDKKRKNKQLFDTMRKLELCKDAKIRRCTRCCAITEDIMLRSRPISSSMRKCLCGSDWTIPDRTESSLGA